MPRTTRTGPNKGLTKTVQTLKEEGRLKPFPEDLKKRHEERLRQSETTVTDRLLNELDGLYADRRHAEEVLDKIEADIAALRRALSQMGVEYV